MRQSKVKHARRRSGGGLTFLTVLSIGGVACLLAGWNAHAPQNVGLSPAEIVALRFPDPRNKVWDEIADARTDGTADARADAAGDADATRYSLFSPYPTMSPPDNAPAVYQTASLTSAPVEVAPRQPATELRVTTEPPAEPRADAKAEPKVQHRPAVVHAKPPAPRSAKRPGAVLSDAQIAGIKTRLNLTPDQREMWPAVEHALRSLSYAKMPADGFRTGAGNTRTAEIDPDSEEVQRLKSAAFPLIMSFSDEQKHELRILAHVAGLEKLATQF